MFKPRKKVFVAMSGGVDSSVAALLLKQQGFLVVGVFMKNWSETIDGITYCTTESDFTDMRAVCQRLKIPHYTFNFEEEYKKRVVDYFFAEYKAGRTPNPDVMCNKEIKFGLFYEKARALGADFIATGHYARRGISSVQHQVANNDSDTKNPTPDTSYQLLTAVDKTKDQTYFLYNVTQDILAHTFFPIGDYQKSEVRELADKFGLPTAHKKDSQGICFIGTVDVKKFLKTKIPINAGKIVDTTGKILGTHEGAWFYTIGQRRIEGLSGTTKPMYVVETNIDKNLVTVGEDSELYGKSVTLESLHLIESGLPAKAIPGHYLAKSRYTPEFSSGNLTQAGDVWTFTFDYPERALTLGQSLVLYDNEVCIGGGVIASVTK